MLSLFMPRRPYLPLLLGLCSLCVLPASAQSGSYGPPTYSGSGTYDPGGGPPTGPPVRSFSTSGGVSGYGGLASGGGNSTLYASGGITPSFTWTGIAPVPQNVIVAQTCVASWSSSYCGTAVSGTCDNGLKGPQSSTGPTFYAQHGWDATEACGNDSSGNSLVVYSVVAGASTLSLATVPVKASITGGTSAGPMAASVSYTAAVTPVTISLGGTYDPVHGDYHVLTGQQITATLSGIVGKVTSYTWSIAPSTTVFETYNTALPSKQLVALSTTDLSGPAAGSTTVAALNFYDSKQEDLTVTCAVTMTAPDGKTILNVTATSPPIRVLKPTAYWTTNPSDPSTGPQFSQAGMGYDALWDASITVPSPFSGGSGCFGQTVYPTADFQRHPSGSQPIHCYLKIPQKNADGTTTYVLPATGLDTYFPYQNSATQHYPQGYSWSVGSPGHSGDSPNVLFSIGAADNGGNLWYNAFASDTFTTWLMYMPPIPTGAGPSVWVPLQRVDWSWTGSVVKDNATGLWKSAVNSQPPVNGSTSNPGLPTDTPPQWSSTNTGTSLLYP